MEKTIRKRTYDTDRSVLVGSYTVSFYGDPAGYEERLYQTEDGLFFLYGTGGGRLAIPAGDHPCRFAGKRRKMA